MTDRSNIIFSIQVLLLVLFLPTVVTAKPQPPYVVHIEADEVTTSGDTIIVSVSAEAWKPSMMQNTVLTLHLPKIGVLEPEKVVLWRNSVDNIERISNNIEREYAISGLVNGEYRVSADISLLSDDSTEPNMVRASSLLFVRVCDHGIFSSGASMVRPRWLELEEEAKRRGFSTKDRKGLKDGAPDLYEKVEQARGGKIPFYECLNDFSKAKYDSNKKRKNISEEMLADLFSIKSKPKIEVNWAEKNSKVMLESVCVFEQPGSKRHQDCRQKAKEDFGTACKRYKDNLSNTYYSKEQYFIKDMEKYCDAARNFNP